MLTTKDNIDKTQQEALEKAEELRVKETEAMLKALDKSQAVISFKPDGTILDANENFLNTVGYSLDEIQGKHHSMFVDAEYEKSNDYKLFWQNLAAGNFDTNVYRRLGKNGKEIWIRASYNPVFDEDGKVYKVVKYATDITETKVKEAYFEGQIAAINKSQAVIEFELDGTIVNANENFLVTLGYDLNEIKGQHHKMFCEASLVNSPEYKEFWNELAAGKFQGGVYKRIKKDGSEIWIRATYNPVFDTNGKPCKVVKFATDITESQLRNADYEGQIEAVSKSQAVIQFEIDGTIIDANENFLNTVGYSLDEIKGKHHRMFCETEYTNSPEYTQFWQSLADGHYQSAEYKRIGKGGKEIWIQASYNPIFDLNGKPFKVVKYATDLTEQKAQKKRDMENIANSFQERVSSIITTVASASTELANTAGLMSEAIATSSNNAQQAVVSAEETYQNVQAVAAASEEMSATIKEISSQTQNVNALITESSERVQGADVFATELQEASQQVRSVIQLISGISSQINLLALNATIESARAGEAGKGFAVVANEVRNLAGQTDKSIQDIEKVINNMSRASEGVVSALSGIRESVDQILASGAGVASAVEEQSAVVGDIAQNMNVATHKTESVKENITTVGSLSQEAEQSSQQVLMASQDLSQQSEVLQKEVSDFLNEIRQGN